MSAGDDISRLVDDDATSSELRAMLDAAIADEPSAAACARMMAGADAIAAGAGGGSAASGASTSASTFAWIGLALVGAVAIASGVYWMSTRGEPAGPAPDRVAASVTAPAVTRETVPAPSPAPSTAPSPAPSTAPSRSDKPRTKPRTVTKRATSPTPRTLSEVALIKQARALAKAGSYAAALRTIRRHTSQYPRGILAEEREVIAIETLVALGSRTAAHTRFGRFVRNYAASGHRQRLRKLVGKSSK